MAADNGQLRSQAALRLHLFATLHRQAPLRTVYMPKAKGIFERAAHVATKWTGSSPALALAIGVVVAWAATGPYFQYNETWQLVINTGTTIVTFLMVFLIQRAQNKDSLAVHLKLNALVAAMQGASNRLISVEDLSEEEVRVLRDHYRELVKLAKRDDNLTESHSIEDAGSRHESKRHGKRAKC
jgi:low affinity Fe/Cu permease